MREVRFYASRLYGTCSHTCLSVWKPLRGPVADWPLALCEPASIRSDIDLEPCDLVYPDYVVENRQVYYSDKLRWFYLSDQMGDEAWVFVQTDTARSDWTGEFCECLPS